MDGLKGDIVNEREELIKINNQIAEVEQELKDLFKLGCPTSKVKIRLHNLQMYQIKLKQAIFNEKYARRKH